MTADRRWQHRWVAPLCWVVLLWCTVLATAAPARAHEFRPGVLTLHQVEAGRYRFAWQPPFDAQRRPIAQIEPKFAEHCQVAGAVVDCGGRGLHHVEFPELSQYSVDVVVRVRFDADRRRTIVLRGDEAVATIGDGSVGQSTAELVMTYGVLGVEHILIGIDHVLFVLGLVLLVGVRRRLFWAVTGFTAAHSITLAASTLGVAALPQAPVEAVIALSIVLLATEVVHERPTVSRRYPGVVAFVFGLLHGFGFAGALAEIGVPADRAWIALLGFNAGVELGQLGIVAVAAIVGRVAARLPHPKRWRLALAYAGGTVATMWTFERVAALWPG